MENLYSHLLGNNDNILLTQIIYYQQKDYLYHILFMQLGCEVIVDIGVIVDHSCLNVLYKTNQDRKDGETRSFVQTFK
jgi:hypothetical protein